MLAPEKLWTRLAQARQAVRHSGSKVMDAQEAIVPFTALLMLGLIWVRTRIQYSRDAKGPLRLTAAGRIYFASAVTLLVVGWLLAPLAGRSLWHVPGVTPTLVRVVWCLATYYIFIIVHRVMKSRRAMVFRSQEPSLTPR
jgi:hypothetical protein